MTAATELPTMAELLETCRRAALDFARADRMLLEERGPVSLAYHLQMLRDDADALLERLERFGQAVEDAGIDGAQIDL